MKISFKNDYSLLLIIINISIFTSSSLIFNYFYASKDKQKQALHTYPNDKLAEKNEIGGYETTFSGKNEYQI